MQTQVLGLSVDSQPCLKAWAESLGGINYPLLSDFFPHGRTASRYGVLRRDGTSERALFVIDKEGILRYVDVHDIDAQPDNDELLRVLAEVDPQAAEAYAAAHPEPPAVEPQAEVVMYCTSWCPGCRRARQFFLDSGIDFVEVDITLDRSAAARVRGWTGGNETTPTFKIRGKVIIDYRLDEIRAALGLQ